MTRNRRRNRPIRSRDVVDARRMVRAARLRAGVEHGCETVLSIMKRFVRFDIPRRSANRWWAPLALVGMIVAGGLAFLVGLAVVVVSGLLRLIVAPLRAASRTSRPRPNPEPPPAADPPPPSPTIQMDKDHDGTWHRR